MPDFEQLNFKVEAQDNASKVLKNILKTLTDLEKKMSNFSNFKMPNINLTNQQIKLLNNWEKLDKKLLNVEKDLKEIGQAQKKLEKFEIVPKGKPLFTYDSATQSYVDNNLGVARREREKIQKQLEEQGIKDLVKVWGKGQIALPMPKLIIPDLENYKPEFIGATKPDWADSFIEDENYITSDIEKYIKNRKINLKKNKLNEILNGLNLNDNYNELLLQVLNKKIPTDSDKQIAKLITDLNNYKNEIKKLKTSFLKTENSDALKRITDNLKIVIEQYKKTKNKIVELKESLKNETTGLGKWSEFGKDYLKPTRTIEKLNKDGSVDKTSYYSEIVGDTVYTYEVVNDEIKKITTQTKKAQKEANKLQNAFKNVKKFMKSIGKIVLYRAIRSAMAEIKKSIQTSFEELAKFDDSYNETLSKFTTAIDKLNASMGLIIRPFVEVLEPAVESIVDYFSQVANYISYATSKTKGLSSYNKINAEYAKDYLESLKEANNLLSFDKFEVLQKQEQKDIYEKVDISLKPDTEDTIEDIGNFLLEGVKSLQSIISIFSNILKILDSIEAIMPLEKIAQIVTKMLQITNNAFEKILDFTKQKGISDVVTFIVSAIEVIANGILEIIDILGALDVLLPLEGIFNILLGVTEVLKGIFGQGEGFINSGLEKILMGVIINPLIDLIGGIVNIFIGLVNVWIKLFEKIFSAFGYEKEFKGLEYWDYRNQNTVSESAGTIDTNDYLKNSTSSYYNSNPISEIKEPLVREQIVNHVFTIDFANTNNNAIARELAGSLATQFKKQNIKVNYN